MNLSKIFVRPFVHACRMQYGRKIPMFHNLSKDESRMAHTKRHSDVDLALAESCEREGAETACKMTL